MNSWKFSDHAQLQVKRSKSMPHGSFPFLHRKNIGAKWNRELQHLGYRQDEGPAELEQMMWWLVLGHFDKVVIVVTYAI